MRSLAPLLFLSFLLSTITVTPRALAGRQVVSKALSEGWEPIKNLNDPHIEEVEEFAISEYNKEVNANFSGIIVLAGGTQKVAGGTKYSLRMRALNTQREVVNCTAVVLELDSDQSMQLLGFVPYKI